MEIFTTVKRQLDTRLAEARTRVLSAGDAAVEDLNYLDDLGAMNNIPKVKVDDKLLRRIVRDAYHVSVIAPRDETEGPVIVDSIFTRMPA